MDDRLEFERVDIQHYIQMSVTVCQISFVKRVLICTFELLLSLFDVKIFVFSYSSVNNCFEIQDLGAYECDFWFSTALVKIAPIFNQP